jgi:hypothetical protein
MWLHIDFVVLALKPLADLGLKPGENFRVTCDIIGAYIEVTFS